MPIYEYECEKCSLRFELKRHFGEDGGASCPFCQGEARRIFSPVHVIFKGSGFYVTDNRRNHPPEEEKDDKIEAGERPERN
jgi:putative FmdB family regulatory protein